MGLIAMTDVEVFGLDEETMSGSRRLLIKATIAKRTMHSVPLRMPSLRR
jgi:hypothetical protein